jgi:hypothetical protein
MRHHDQDSLAISRITLGCRICGLFRDRIQLCSGLVDLVVCVGHHRGRRHSLALAGQWFVGLIAEDIAEVGDRGVDVGVRGRRPGRRVRGSRTRSRVVGRRRIRRQVPRRGHWADEAAGRGGLFAGRLLPPMAARPPVARSSVRESCVRASAWASSDSAGADRFQGQCRHQSL